jgi:small GTP-binding protein
MKTRKKKNVGLKMFISLIILLLISIIVFIVYKKKMKSETAIKRDSETVIERENKSEEWVIFLGDENVGKSCILVKFEGKVNCPPDKHLKTLGYDNIQINNINILDVPGNKMFRKNISDAVQKATNIKYFVLVYDITDENTFKSIDEWVNIVNESESSQKRIILVGNKTDLQTQRKVTTEAGQNKANKIGALKFFETSSNTGTNIEELLTFISNSISFEFKNPLTLL